MSFLDVVIAPSTLAARVLNPLQSLFALAARWYVSAQFLKAGYLKFSSWDSTVYLFETEYHTPWLSPQDAALAGTFGELFFPALLVLGLYARLSAIGLLVVNIVAVISYSQVLLAPGSEAALAQHILWGVLILAVIVYGPGKISVDYAMNRARS